MNYDDAVILAREIKTAIEPYCSFCEVAGSIRRKKPDLIKDVEIVAVPRPECMAALKAIVNSKWGPPEIGAFPSKYTKIRGALANIDFFWCDARTVGLNFFIRTGPADFGQRALQHWKDITKGGYSKGAQLHRADGTIVPTPTEQAVFEALQCKFVAPENRRERPKNYVPRRNGK